MRSMHRGRLAGGLLLMMGAMAVPAAAASKNGQITLPVVVEPATPDNGEPVEVAAQKLFGKQAAHVGSLAQEIGEELLRAKLLIETGRAAQDVLTLRRSEHDVLPEHAALRGLCADERAQIETVECGLKLLVRDRAQPL